MYGKLLSVIEKENSIEVSYEKKKVYITILRNDIFRFFSDGDGIRRHSFAIEGDKRVDTDYLMFPREDGFLVTTKKYCIIIKDEGIIEVGDEDGNILMSTYTGPKKEVPRYGERAMALLAAEGHDVSKFNSRVEHPVNVSFALGKDDCVYGLGDKTGLLNKRGYEYENWNSDIPDAHTDGFKALYKSIPVVYIKKETGSYGLFFDNTYHAYFDIGKADGNVLSYSADGGNLDFYFIGGSSLKEVVGGYTYLTGTANLPELWTLGYHQCRWGYECADDIRGVGKKFRELMIPCESVQYDIDYMDGYRVFTWNEKDYEPLGKLFDDMKKEGFKPVIIIDPGTKVDDKYFMCKEGAEKGYFATDKNGKIYVNRVWPGDSNYPDFGRKEVREWWGNHHKELLDAGVGGIWNDMNEPASFEGPLPLDVCFHDEDRATNHGEIHNVYGHLMSKATYEGMKKINGKRPFVITRACYAGTQKYSAVWTGDNQSLWAHLQMLIPQLCNLGMSGVALAGTDIGGFGSDCTKELMIRWIEAASFSTFFRNHSATGVKRQEPWQFDDETVNIYRKYVELHYKFLPYIYNLMYKCESTGLPVMRPLVLEFEDDPNVLNMNDEFMVGESLLVAPILMGGSTHRSVYLPKGVWYDYWTGEKIVGGSYFVKEAPLDVMPIYVKAGAVIPMMKVVQHIDEHTMDSIELLYTPEGGTADVYKDAGTGFGYRDGEYNLYRFEVSPGGSITKRMLHEGYKDFKEIEAIRVC